MDKITKDIMGNSFMKLDNPEFDKMLMGKIYKESRKQKRWFTILSSTLLFIITDIFIFLLLKTFNISIFSADSSEHTAPYEFILGLKSILGAFLGNSVMQYSILAVIVLILFSRITSSGLKYT